MKKEKKIYIPLAESRIEPEIKSELHFESDSNSFFVYDTPENRIRFKDILPIGFRPAEELNFEIDLIPKTSWGASLSNSLEKESWDEIRSTFVHACGNRCQVCGNVGTDLSNSIRDVDTHELWQYDDLNSAIKTQKLVGFLCLCSSCHLMFHLGFSKTINKFDITKKRLMALEKKTEKEIDDKIDSIFSIWQKRSLYKWNIDVSLINSFDLKFKDNEKVNNTTFIY